jgi:hypothetical protein
MESKDERACRIGSGNDFDGGSNADSNSNSNFDPSSDSEPNDEYDNECSNDNDSFGSDAIGVEFQLGQHRLEKLGLLVVLATVQLRRDPEEAPATL